MPNFASNILFSIDTALQLVGGVNSQSIVAHYQLDYQKSSIQIINNSSGAPLEVRLPVGQSLKSGVYFFIRSSGSAALTIQGEGGATKATLASNESALFACDGTNWHLVIKGS